MTQEIENLLSECPAGYDLGNCEGFSVRAIVHEAFVSNERALEYCETEETVHSRHSHTFSRVSREANFLLHYTMSPFTIFRLVHSSVKSLQITLLLLPSTERKLFFKLDDYSMHLRCRAIAKVVVSILSTVEFCTLLIVCYSYFKWNSYVSLRSSSRL